MTTLSTTTAASTMRTLSRACHSRVVHDNSRPRPTLSNGVISLPARVHRHCRQIYPRVCLQIKYEVRKVKMSLVFVESNRDFLNRIFIVQVECPKVLKSRFKSQLPITATLPYRPTACVFAKRSTVRRRTLVVHSGAYTLGSGSGGGAQAPPSRGYAPKYSRPQIVARHPDLAALLTHWSATDSRKNR